MQIQHRVRTIVLKKPKCNQLLLLVVITWEVVNEKWHFFDKRLFSCCFVHFTNCVTNCAGAHEPFWCSKTIELNELK